MLLFRLLNTFSEILAYFFDVTQHESVTGAKHAVQYLNDVSSDVTFELVMIQTQDNETALALDNGRIPS